MRGVQVTRSVFSGIFCLHNTQTKKLIETFSPASRTHTHTHTYLMRVFARFAAWFPCGFQLVKQYNIIYTQVRVYKHTRRTRVPTHLITPGGNFMWIKHGVFQLNIHRTSRNNEPTSSFFFFFFFDPAMGRYLRALCKKHTSSTPFSYHIVVHSNYNNVMGKNNIIRAPRAPILIACCSSRFIAMYK